MTLPTEPARRWFALTGLGEIVSAGTHSCFEEADQVMPDTVWLLDEETAREWRDALNQLLDANKEA